MSLESKREGRILLTGISQKTTWGLFDKNGVKDEIGTLNLLTPDVVTNAAKEIHSGRSVSLNWGLDKMHQPGFGRTSLQHKFVDWRKKDGFDFFSYDDEITVNTQTGMCCRLGYSSSILLT